MHVPVKLDLTRNVLNAPLVFTYSTDCASSGLADPLSVPVSCNLRAVAVIMLGRARAKSLM